MRTIRSSVLALIAMAAACVETKAVQCAGGGVCPEGTACDEVHGACVRPEQLGACTPEQEGEVCDIAGQPIGVCSQTVCLESRCGDGIVVGAEQCDGTNLGERENAGSCKLGFGFHDDGVVTCTPQCTYDLSACARVCGDGVLDPEEVCDGAQLGGFATCQEVGYYDGGGLACNGACTYDTTTCDRRCGDGVRDPEEVCDGAPPTETCLDYGYDAGFLGCAALVCAPDVQSCRRFGWNRLQLPTPVSIRAIATAGDTLFAGMTNGRVMTYRGGAVTITLVDAENENHVDDIWAASPTDVWAVTEGSATVLHFDGTSWTATPRSLGTHRVLWGSGSSNVYLFQTGAAGSLRYDGTTWAADPAVPALGHARDAWGSGANDIWLLGAPAPGTGHAVFHFDGTSWSTVTSVPIAQPVAVGGVGSTVFIAGSDGAGNLRVARRKGGAWQTFALETMTDAALVNPVAHSIEARAEDDVWLSANNVLYHFDGAAWTLHVQPTSWLDASAVGHVGDEWIAGGSTEGAANPTFRFEGTSLVDLIQPDPQQALVTQLPVDTRLTAAWAAASDDIWVASRAVVGGSVDPVRLHHFDGVAWTERFNAGSDLEDVADLWGVSSAEIYGARRGLGMFRYDGTSWALDTQGGLAGGVALAVWGSDSQNVWASGLGKIWRRDPATGWAVAHNVLGAMYDVFGRGPNDVWVVGATGAVHHWNGTQWTPHTTGTTAQLRGVWTAPGAPVVVGGEGGVILQHDGTSWTTMPTPTSATLLAIYGHAADDIFAVGEGSTVLHYDGARWSRVRVDAQHALTAVTGAGQTTLFVGGGLSGPPVARQLDRMRPW